MYLQHQFPKWHVDCEYNRDKFDAKRLVDSEDNPHGEIANCRTVFPDLVVHKRGTKRNHLVIEVKKSTSRIPHDEDLRKLRGFKEQFNYAYTVFIELACHGTSGVSHVEWIDA